jgi:hypothetical protein
VRAVVLDAARSCSDPRRASGAPDLWLTLADEFCTARSQASNDGVDVADGECDVADSRHVRRRVLVVAWFDSNLVHLLQTAGSVASTCGPGSRATSAPHAQRHAGAARRRAARLTRAHEDASEPRHHCPDPRLLGDPAQLGAVEGSLREAGLPRTHLWLPRCRGRGRGPECRPQPRSRT